jgi:hypothetical protein
LHGFVKCVTCTVFHIEKICECVLYGFIRYLKSAKVNLRLANITSPLPRMTSHAVHEAMVGTTTDLRKVKTALLSVFNKDGLEEFGLFLQAQGVTIGKLKMFVRVTCACQILNFLPQFLLPVLSSLFFTLYSLHGWHGQKTSCCRLHRGGCL